MYTEPQKTLIAALNSERLDERLAALSALREEEMGGRLALPVPASDVNNHIHTNYSFSPYSPTAAVFKSLEAGLATCGLMDHDSIGGSAEFCEAGRIAGIPTTQGCELRVSFKGTFLENQRINNPDQIGVAYIALHGIPETSVAAVAAFLEPIRAARLERNRQMTERLNGLISTPELHIDFERDIVAQSLYREGGEVTERHLLFALANKLIAFMGKGPRLCAYLEERLQLPLNAKVRAQLSDVENPYYDYDLLGLFKGYYVSSFYVDAVEECPPVGEVAAFAKAHSIVLAYPYLGDVTASVTGDKAAQAFEDAFLDELFPLLQGLGFNAVTFMPSRNTDAQLQRLMKLCRRYNFFQISGEDINQPRQQFICEALRQAHFAHLTDAAWALIGHERAAARNPEQGMFAPEMIAALPSLEERIQHFKKLGLQA